MKEVESKTEDLSTTTLCTAAPFGSLAEVIKTNKIEPLNGNFCELGSLCVFHGIVNSISPKRDRGFTKA